MELRGYERSETESRYYSVIELYNSIESVRGTVLLNWEWTPKQVEKLEFQSRNYKGLFFIYNEIIRQIAEFNKKKPK